MKQLSEDHSEIRLSAFQVMVEIFERSHSFRNIVVDSLQELFVLILETEPSRGLPPPKEAKKRLKSLSISTIESWVKTYGDTYRFVTCFISYSALLFGEVDLFGPRGTSFVSLMVGALI